MRDYPAGWPADADVSVVPEAYMYVDGGVWPPVDWERQTGPGESKLGSVRIQRQLKSRALPGQIRAAAGFSTADGSVTFGKPLGDPTIEVAPLAPWQRGMSGVPASGSCEIVLKHEGADPMPLGRFDFDPISSRATDPTVTVDLVEATAALDRPLRLPFLSVHPAQEAPAARGDASWWLDQCARQAGWYATPAEVDSCVASMPLVGSWWPQKGSPDQAGAFSWVNDPVLGSALGGTTLNPGVIHQMIDQASFYVTLTFTGTVFISFRSSHDRVMWVALTDTGRWDVAFTDDEQDPPAPLFGFPLPHTFPYGDDPTHPHRVTLRVGGLQDSSTEWSASIKSAFGSSWTNLGSPGESLVPQGVSLTGFHVPDGAGSLQGLQVHLDDDEGVWAAPSAIIPGLDSPIASYWVEPGSTIRDVMASVVDAHLAARLMDPAGRLVIRDRHWLRGGGPVVDEIIVDDELEDVPWTVDPSEQANRWEVDYRPASVDVTSTLWAADTVIKMGPHMPVEVRAELDGQALGPLRVNWSARENPDGTGNWADASKLTAWVVEATMNTARVTIVNHTPDTWYMVNDSGSPRVEIVADGEAGSLRAGQEMVTGRGIRADHPRANPLRLDAGSWIQDEQAARDLMEHLRAITSGVRWRVDGVRVRFDPRRDVGDIVRLVADPDGAAAGLSTKAIITSIDLTMGPGSAEQVLGLVILPPTVGDFNTAWAEAVEGGATVGDFNDVWDGLLMLDFNDDPLRTPDEES